LKILFLEDQPCIRAFKYAKGLKAFSSDIELYFGYRGLSLDEFYGHGDELFDGWLKINGDDTQTLKSIVQKVNPDIIHSHNGPDSLTVISVHSFKNSIPIVHDIHDLMSIRNTAYDDGFDREDVSPSSIKHEEKIAIEESDAIITVSKTILDIAYQKYNLDGKANLVFPNYAVHEMIPQNLKEKLSSSDGMIHFVYQGHLDGERSGGHYDLHDIFQKISKQGIHIHIYPSRENSFYCKLAEKDPFIHYHGSHPPRVLMTEITQYDFGWSGFNISKNKDHVDTVLANKTIEYIAAGLPVISFPHKAQKHFIEKYGVGIIINNLNNLFKALTSKSTKKVKKRVLDHRYAFTVENQIREIYQFYENILGS